MIGVVKVDAEELVREVRALSEKLDQLPCLREANEEDCDPDLVARELACLLASRGLAYEDALFVLEAAKAELGKFRLTVGAPCRSPLATQQ